jgi:hypothetical protein
MIMNGEKIILGTDRDLFEVGLLFLRSAGEREGGRERAEIMETCVRIRRDSKYIPLECRP